MAYKVCPDFVNGKRMIGSVNMFPESFVGEAEERF